MITLTINDWKGHSNVLSLKNDYHSNENLQCPLYFIFYCNMHLKKNYSHNIITWTKIAIPLSDIHFNKVKKCYFIQISL